MAFEDNPILFHLFRGQRGIHTINAETGGAHTAYYIVASSETLHVARTYLFSVVGQKDFSEKKLREQTGQIFKEKDRDGNISAVPRGRLLTEMMGRSLEASWLREQSIWGLLFPKSVFSFSSGGEPKDIRS
jgi:hypothetical protein